MIRQFIESIKKISGPRSYILFIFCVISVGIFLRLYILDSQIVGGDELHGVRQAAVRSYSYILHNFKQADNCIPLTMYYKFLLQTSHLSEWGLRSLQIISGLLLLILSPLFLKSIFKKKTIALFLVFMAISPLLIYYSRFGRPYGIIVLLSFVSIFSFYIWTQTRKKIHAGVYCVTATLAPYFNLFSFPVVAAPLVYTFIFQLFMKNKENNTNAVSFPKIKHLFLLGMLVIAGIAIWFLPVIDTLPTITSKISEGFICLRTITGTLTLFNGSHNLFISVMLGGIFIYGLSRGLKENKFLFGLLLSIFLCTALSMIIVKPAMIQSPLVLARYSISCLSFWLLVLSFGLYDLYSRIRSFLMTNEKKLNPVLNILVFLFFASILFTNPMLHLYLSKSSFTTHHDFLNPSYKDLAAVYKNQPDLIPRFYLDLKEEAQNIRIIEAPPLMRWAFMNYHFYQQIHRKRVAIGYSRDLIEEQSSPFRDKGIRFRSYLNIDNIDALISSDYRYIVIHHDILKETLRVRKSVNLDFAIRDDMSWEKVEDSSLRRQFRDRARIYIERFKKLFGDPYFTDNRITVFKITQAVYKPSRF